MWKHIPDTKYEKMLQSSEPILTSSARRELQQQQERDAATTLTRRHWAEKEAAHAAEASAVDRYVSREFAKLAKGVEGLRVVRPRKGKEASSSRGPVAPTASIGAAASDAPSVKCTRQPVGPSSCFSSPPSRSAAPSAATGNVSRPSPASRHRQHFSTGFPTPFAESGFQSILQWAWVSFEEARVVALGPGAQLGRQRASGDNGGAPPRLLTAVACYILDEVLRHGSGGASHCGGGAMATGTTTLTTAGGATTLSRLWADLRLPILDAIFSPQLIGADWPRREQRRQLQLQQAPSRHISSDDSDRSGGEDGSNGGSGNTGAGADAGTVKGSARQHHHTRAEADDGAPRCDTVRQTTYTCIGDFAAYRLWYEEADSARTDNALLAGRIAALTARAALGERVVRLTEHRHMRAQLRAVLTAWRAHTREAQHRREAIAASLAHSRQRTLEGSCFLRWRRITVQSHADGHRARVRELEATLRTQAEEHAQALAEYRNRLIEANASSATLRLTHETLRCQLAQQSELESGVLRVALARARERARLLAIHARRWERLAKTFRPQVMCPAPTNALITLGRQLRGWERDLTTRLALTQRQLIASAMASGAAGTATAAAIATASPAISEAFDRREPAVPASSLRQRAITSVLEKLLLRWVNFVMFSAVKGSGEAQTQLARLQREHRLLLGCDLGGTGIGGVRRSITNTAGGGIGTNYTETDFSFWVPVNAFEGHRVPKLSARAAAEDRTTQGKSDGVAPNRIRDAVAASAASHKRADTTALGSPASASAVVAAAEGPSHTVTLLTLRCLVGELLRQVRAQEGLASCADASPVLTTGERPPSAVTAARQSMAAASATSTTTTSTVPGAGHSLVADGPWRVELEAVNLRAALAASAAVAASVTVEEEAEVIAQGNQRDGLGLIPYTVRDSTSVALGNDGAGGGRRKNVVNSGRAFAGRLSIAAAKLAKGAGEEDGIDPVFHDLASLLIAYSSGGLYPPLITLARSGPLTPAPTPAQLQRFLFPHQGGGITATPTNKATPAVAGGGYNHSAMLWVLATLFTGHVRACYGAEAFLPSAATARTQTRMVPSGGEKGGRCPRGSGVGCGAGRASLKSSVPVSAVSLSVANRTDGGTANGGGGVRAPSPGATSLLATTSPTATGRGRTSPTPGGNQQRLTRRMVSLTTTTLDARDDASNVVASTTGPATAVVPPSVHSAAPWPLLATAQKATAATALATVDDTASDMDVYLGLRDPVVPMSDVERDSDDGEDSAAGEDAAELETVMAHLAHVEEAQMAQRGRQRRLGKVSDIPLTSLNGEETEREGVSLLRCDDAPVLEGIRQGGAAGASVSGGGLRHSRARASILLGEEPECDTTSSSSASADVTDNDEDKMCEKSGHRQSNHPRSGNDLPPAHLPTRGGAGRSKGSMEHPSISARSRVASLRSARQPADGNSSDAAADAAEARFWMEEAVTEGSTPAPPDLGADIENSDSDEKDLTSHSRRILRHFPRRSRAFDVPTAAALRRGSRSRMGSGVSVSATVVASGLDGGDGVGACGIADDDDGALGERTARRRRARRRRHALRAFVDLSVRDRERRQRWLALARVVTALVVRWGILDPQATEGRGTAAAADSARHGARRAQSAGSDEADGSSRRSSTRSARRSATRDDSPASNARDAGCPGSGGLRATQPGGDANTDASPSLARAAFVGPLTRVPPRHEVGPSQRRAGAAATAARSEERAAATATLAASTAGPDSYQCFAISGPVRPRPQPRPPSPPPEPRGPLDPLTVRPAVPVLPQHSQSSRTHFSLQSKRHNH